MQNVTLIKARRVAPKEGRMWTAKAEESDFGGAIVGNAKYTRSYLICMHIVTALALALSRARAHASRATHMHVHRRLRERRGEGERGEGGVGPTPRGQARIYGRVADNTPTIVSTHLHLRCPFARMHARKGRAHARAETRARAGRTLQILVHYQKCQ